MSMKPRPAPRRWLGRAEYAATVFLSSVLSFPAEGNTIVFADSIRFATPKVIMGIPYVRSVAIADMNHDGLNDIVIGVWGPSDPAPKTLRVFWQNWQNVIDPTPTDLGEELFVADIQAADLNGDGLADLVLADQYGNGVRIIYQDFSGSLHEVPSLKGSYGSFSIRVVDVNSDGLLDIVSLPIYYAGLYYGHAHSSNAPDSFLVYYQQQGSKFDSLRYYPLNKSIVKTESWANIQAADVNGDGLTDIVISGGEWDKNISIYLQQKTGELKFERHIGYDEWIRNIAIADFTGDGRNDIAAGLMFSDTAGSFVCLYVQDSTGHFPDRPLLYDAYPLPITVHAADLDMDGRQDLVVSHYNYYAMSFYRQKESGGFEPYIKRGFANRDADFQASVAVGDINGDGKPDIATVAILGDLVYMINTTGQGSGTLAEEPWLNRPESYGLQPNYPNPFNPSTTIRFELPKRVEVSLKVYNVLGEEIATPVEGERGPGKEAVEFDGRNLPSGMYFYCLRVEGHIETRKMLLLK
ncbi:MAG: FG-GAP-like repeat-containing protein [Bacteroidota bacterium]